MHTLLVYVPQSDGKVRLRKILFEFRIDSDHVKQSEVDVALRAYLTDRTRYTWTEDAAYKARLHGRSDLGRSRGAL